jgi:3-isopropylmalate dehydratase small subunit
MRERWVCPDDETVNLVGHPCAGCGSSREVALLAAQCREGA